MNPRGHGIRERRGDARNAVNDWIIPVNESHVVRNDQPPRKWPIFFIRLRTRNSMVKECECVRSSASPIAFLRWNCWMVRSKCIACHFLVTRQFYRLFRFPSSNYAASFVMILGGIKSLQLLLFMFNRAEIDYRYPNHPVRKRKLHVSQNDMRLIGKQKKQVFLNWTILKIKMKLFLFQVCTLQHTISMYYSASLLFLLHYTKTCEYDKLEVWNIYERRVVIWIS